MNEDWFLSELGQRIRRQRERRGLSLSELAERSELSRRYLTETEAGRANPSIIKLAGIARALRLGLAELCDLPLEERRRGRIALVGSDFGQHVALGRKLAFLAERPLVEFERRLAQRARMTCDEVRERAQAAWVGEMEGEVLEHYLTHDGDSILVTGPYLYQRPANWERLLSSCFTVWLQPRRTATSRSAGKSGGLDLDRDFLYGRAHMTLVTEGHTLDEMAREVLGAAL